MAALSRASQARRIALMAAYGAAYGGGGLGLLGAAMAGVLIGQTRLARRAIGVLDGGPPHCDGLYGHEHPGEPLVMAMLGDSAAAGLGCDLPRETPGALLAAGLAEVLERPVRLVCTAVVGAITADLDRQIDEISEHRPEIVAIIVGGNDVTRLNRLSLAAEQLNHAVHRLREGGAEVIVGTCPDLGTIEPLQQPLRWVARRLSRDLAAAQTVAVVEAGGRSVSLGDLLGPEFAAEPRVMFARDRFHPSARGYAAAAAAMLPSVAAAAGAWDDMPDEPSDARGEGVRSLPRAAAEAADAAGTEVSATQVAGRDRGPWGTWAELRHRIRLFTRLPADPETDPAIDPDDEGSRSDGGKPPDAAAAGDQR